MVQLPAVLGDGLGFWALATSVGDKDKVPGLCLAHVGQCDHLKSEPDGERSVFPLSVLLVQNK